MTRKFEKITGYDEAIIPERQTKNAAGYDFCAYEDTIIPPLFENGVFNKPVLVPTGIKACFENDEVLVLANRSSNPLKNRLILANGIGVIDSDYYNNEGNEGHIMFQFINLSTEPITLKKGDRIGQGMFQKFLKTDDDNVDKERIGGFGSTNK